MNRFHYNQTKDDLSLNGWLKLLPVVAFLILSVARSQADECTSRWVSLEADSNETTRRIIKSEVENRKGFTSSQEDKLNILLVEQESQKEASAYKAATDAANNEFERSKRRLDILEEQFQTTSYDLEELIKNILNIRATTKNIDNQIARYEDDR